jgi:hypothetical protein
LPSRRPIGFRLRDQLAWLGGWWSGPLLVEDAAACHPPAGTSWSVVSSASARCCRFGIELPLAEIYDGLSMPAPVGAPTTPAASTG